jgi:hypothetical protein
MGRLCEIGPIAPFLFFSSFSFSVFFSFLFLEFKFEFSFNCELIFILNVQIEHTNMGGFYLFFSFLFFSLLFPILKYSKWVLNPQFGTLIYFLTVITIFTRCTYNKTNMMHNYF